MMQEKDDTRLAILRAAKTEFAGKGFSGARMSSIAEKAKANQALIHYYFGSKENLYKEVLASLFGPEKCTGDTELQHTWQITTKQKLFLVLHIVAKIHLLAPDREGHRIFLWEIAEGRNFIRPFIDKFMVPRIESMLNIIEKGISEGVFQTPSPLLSVMNLFMLLDGIEAQTTFFEGTKFEPIMTPDEKEKTFYDYTITTFFKSITPDGMIAEIPTVPADLLAFVDSLLAKMFESSDSEFSCKLMSQIIALLKA